MPVPDDKAERVGDFNVESSKTSFEIDREEVANKAGAETTGPAGDDEFEEREDFSPIMPYPAPPPNSARSVKSRFTLAPRRQQQQRSAGSASRKDRIIPSSVVIDSIDPTGEVKIQEKDTVLDSGNSSNYNAETIKPKYNAVFFQISQSIDIQNGGNESVASTISGNHDGKNFISSFVDFRGKESQNNVSMGANILNYKPGFLRSPSPKKVKFLDSNSMGRKTAPSTRMSLPSEIPEDDYEENEMTEKQEVLEIKSISSAQSKKSDSRRNLKPSKCEAIHLTDLQQRYAALNKNLSKSAQVLSVAPRPVAGFPTSNPVKNGSFMLSKRNNAKDEVNQRNNKTSSNANTIGNTNKTVGISLYSFDNLSKSVDLNNNHGNYRLMSKLPSLEDWKDVTHSAASSNNTNTKENNVKRFSNTNTQAPAMDDNDTGSLLNSRQTSAAATGSDFAAIPESRLATRGTMRPWSGTCSISVGGGEQDEDDSDDNDVYLEEDASKGVKGIDFGIHRSNINIDTPITQKPLINTTMPSEQQVTRTSLSVESQSIKPGNNISINAFRPSKSVHRINSSQAKANNQVKTRKIIDRKKQEAIIMDMYKKKGFKESQPVKGFSAVEEPNISGFLKGIPLDNFSKRGKPRSKSLGREVSRKDSSPSHYPHHHSPSPHAKGKENCSFGIQVSPDLKKDKDGVNLLAHLANRGGRDVLFTPRYDFRVGKRAPVKENINLASPKVSKSSKNSDLITTVKICPSPPVILEENNVESVKPQQEVKLVRTDVLSPTKSPQGILKVNNNNSLNSVPRKSLSQTTPKNNRSNTKTNFNSNKANSNTKTTNRLQTQQEPEKTTTVPTNSNSKSQNGIQPNVEVMFDVHHYAGFQHAKFGKNGGNKPDSNNNKNKVTDWAKDKPANYNEELKTKFLKVSVGGDGFNRMPSESFDGSTSSSSSLS